MNIIAAVTTTSVRGEVVERREMKRKKNIRRNGKAKAKAKCPTANFFCM